MNLHERGPGSELQYQMPDQTHCLIVGSFPALDRSAPTSEARDKSQTLDKFLLALLSRGSLEKTEPRCLGPPSRGSSGSVTYPPVSFYSKTTLVGYSTVLLVFQSSVQKPHGSNEENKCHDGPLSAGLWAIR